MSLLFERGRFGPADTSAVTWVLAAYAAGLLGYATVRLLATAFYAFHDTRTPVRIAVFALVLNVALGAALATVLGTPGIGLATAAAATVNALALARPLRRRLGNLLTRDQRSWARRTVLAAGLAGLAGAWPYLWLLERWAEWPLPSRLAGTALLYGGVGAAYLAAARLLGVSGRLR